MGGVKEVQGQSHRCLCCQGECSEVWVAAWGPLTAGPMFQKPSHSCCGWLPLVLQIVLEGIGGALLWAPKAPGMPSILCSREEAADEPASLPLLAHLSWVSAICLLSPPSPFPPSLTLSEPED